MLNFKELESLRTKEELINYFKAMGKNITEEEIEALKKSYEQAEENNSTLTLQQLDNVAGGLICGHINIATIESTIIENHRRLDAETLAKTLTDYGQNSAGVHFIHADVGKEDGSVNFILEDGNLNANGITITEIQVTKQGKIQLTGGGTDIKDITLSITQLGESTSSYSNHNIFPQGNPENLMSIEQLFARPTGGNVPLIPVVSNADHSSPNSLEHDFVRLAEMAGQRETDGYKPYTFSFNGVQHGGWDRLITYLNDHVPESNILNKEFNPSTSTLVKHFFKSGAYKVPLKYAFEFAAAVGITYGVLEFLKYMANNTDDQKKDNQEHRDITPV